MVIMKKSEEAIKKFITSVSPNNLGLTPGINPIKICISPNRVNKNPIPADIHAIQSDNFSFVFIVLSICSAKINKFLLINV